MNDTNIQLLNNLDRKLLILLILVNVDFSELLFDLLDELFGIEVFLVVGEHLVGLAEVFVGLFESGEHAVGFGKIHVNVVLGRLSQIVGFVHGEQFFAVVDALGKVVSDQVHVTQVLVGVLDEIRVLLLDLQLDLLLVINIVLLIVWQLLLFHTLNDCFCQGLTLVILERRWVLNVFLNVDGALGLIEECLLCDIHCLDLFIYNDLILDAVPNLILDLVLNARQSVLHIHDRIVERKTLSKTRVRLLPDLNGILLVLLLLRLRQVLQRIGIQLLVNIQEVFLRFFKVLAFEFFGEVFHLLDRVSFAGQ